MAETGQQLRLRVGDLLLDRGTRSVSRRGEAIELPRLSYRLFEVIVAAAPNVVTSDDLAREVWPDRVVSPETITQRVKLLRKAIGDDAKNPRYIGLVRGEGYRMLADVRPAETAGATSIPALFARFGRKGLIAAAVLILTAAAGLFYLTYPDARPGEGDAAGEGIERTEIRPHAVAVLPFQLTSADTGDLYRSEGMADELRDQLGRIAGLQIAARTSSVSFRNQDLLATEISQRLGVGLLVEGSLRIDQGQVRVSVQIIDGPSGLQKWTNSYTRSDERMIEVQQEIAADVARQLMLVAGIDVATVDPITQVASAYDLILQARFLEQQIRDDQTVDTAKHERVVDLYRRATEADPGSAIAFSRLAAAHLYIGDVASAQAPIFQALTLQANLSHVQYTLGQYYWLNGHQHAGNAYAEAIRLNPQNADALGAYAQWLWHQPDATEPGEYFRRAVLNDQESLERYRDLGAFYGVTGRRDEALALAQEIQSRFDSPRAFQVLARIHEHTGDLDIAIAWLRRARRAEPDNDEFSWNMAELYSRIGAPDLANFFQPEAAMGKFFWQRRYPELIELGEELMLEYPSELPIRYMLGFAYNTQGRHEQAIHVLESAGLPDRALRSGRFAAAVEALVTLTDAYTAVGRTEDAEQASKFLVDFFEAHIATGADRSWWPHLYLACVRSLSGDDDAALRHLRKIMAAPELAWDPVLRDAGCFRSYAADADYQSVLDDQNTRRASLRERLAETLERFAESDDLERPAQ